MVGCIEWRNKIWFEANSNELKQLLDEMHKAHAAYVSNPSSCFHKGKWQEAIARVQRTLHETENQRWMNKAKEIQRLADANDHQNFYSALKQIYGLSSRSLAPVRTVYGASSLTSRDDILKRWEEHYKQLLNTNNRCDFIILNQIPDFPVAEEVAVEPLLREVQTAIASLK